MGADRPLLDLHPSQWPERFVELGAKAFQGRNAARWVFQKGAADWAVMTDLPADLRARLQEEEAFLQSQVLKSSEAGDGAVKLLLGFPDGATTEAVGMPGSAGRTICLSTQVGCPVRCLFCASGMEGLGRNLSQAEILEQALQLRQEQGEFQRVVVMGMGDAGFNLDATLGALEVLMDGEGFGLSARRITLSTVAPKGALPRLAQWARPISLALSLHAPDDALRRELVPGVAKRTIAETLEEADALFAAAGREYTVEYVLLRDVNDSAEQADALADLLRGRRCHVNLIPYNEVEETDFRRPHPDAMQRFLLRLRMEGVGSTLRRSLGREADAACGQLRRRHSQQGDAGNLDQS